MTAPLSQEARERLAAGLLCKCGHDIGGEHNTNGCYATVDYGTATQRACPCHLTDDQDPLDALAPVVADLLAEQRAGIAAAIRERQGNALMRELLKLPCNDVALLAVEWAESVAETYGDES